MGGWITKVLAESTIEIERPLFATGTSHHLEQLSTRAAEHTPYMSLSVGRSGSCRQGTILMRKFVFCSERVQTRQSWVKNAVVRAHNSANACDMTGG